MAYHRAVRLLAIVAALALTACESSRDPQRAADAGAAAAGAGAARIRLFDAGREPRAAARFAFVPGRREQAVLEIDSRLTRGSETLQDEHASIRLDVRYPSADRVELTVRRAETTAADIPRIESAVGLRFAQRFHGTGETDLPEITFPDAAEPRSADYVRGAVVQVASNLLPVMPAEPVGGGARWARDELRFTLVAPPGELFSVERRSGIHGPTRLDTGETVIVNEEQVYRMDAPAKGIARHVEAELVAGQPGGATRTTRLRFDVSAAP